MNLSPVAESSPSYWLPGITRAAASRHAADVCILLGLAFIAAWTSYGASAWIAFNAWDVWFESSLPRIYSNMAAMHSDQSRSHLHPLFSLLVYPPTTVLRKIFHLAPIVAVRLVLASVASLWISLLYLLLRSIECRRLDAGVLSLLALMSAAALFWLPVPETYPLGSCSILLALLLMNTLPRTSFLGYVLINVVSVSVTVTNWMAGFLATLINQGWKRSLQVCASALALVVLLSAMQKVLFPSAKYFFEEHKSEAKYLLRPEAGGPAKILRALLFHSMVMPEIIVVNNKDSLLETGTVSVDLGKKMTVQRSPLGSGTSWAWIAVSLWACLLCLGIWALVTVREEVRFRLVLGPLLCGQLMLHLLYGEETFLYAIHVAPLLILMVGMATLTPIRPLVLGLVAFLILTMGANNLQQFTQAIKAQDDLRRPYQEAMVKKPIDAAPAQ